jgi:hypothetical protein
MDNETKTSRTRAWAARRLRAVADWYDIGAVLATLGAALLFILSAATYYGYFPASLVDNLTYGELAVLGVLLVAVAIAMEGLKNSTRRRGGSR